MWNNLKNSLANHINTKLGGTNITLSDPIPGSKLDFDTDSDGTADSGDPLAITDGSILSVAVGKFTGLKVVAQSTPNSTVIVKAGYALDPRGKGVLTVAADTTTLGMAAVSGGNKRIDLVTLDSDGSIAIYMGVETTGTPAPPPYPTTAVSLAEVLFQNASAITKDFNDGTNNYISKDARPILGWPSPRASRFSSPWFNDDFNYLRFSGGPPLTITKNNYGQGTGSASDETDLYTFQNNAGSGGSVGYGSTLDGTHTQIITNVSGSAEHSAEAARRWWRLVDGGMCFEIKAKLSANNLNPFIGLTTVHPGDRTLSQSDDDAIYFSNDGGTNTLDLRSQNGNSPSLSDNIAVTDLTAFNTYRIEVRNRMYISGSNAPLSVVRMYINDALKASFNSTSDNVPRTADDELFPAWGLSSTGSLTVDYVLFYSLEE